MYSGHQSCLCVARLFAVNKLFGLLRTVLGRSRRVALPLVRNMAAVDATKVHQMDANAAPQAFTSPPNFTPDKTEIWEVAAEAIEATEIRWVFAIWNEQRGIRSMPSREDMSPRRLGRLLQNVSLVRVLAESHDYEFRIVGDVHVQVYGASGVRLKLSEV